jgi:hypothetical protein
MGRNEIEVEWDHGAPPPTGPRAPLFGDDAALWRVFWGLLILTTVVKAVLALQINVIWEEAYYTVLGRHPDVGYPDIPPGAPALSAALTGLFGWTEAGLRLPNLLLAQAIPVAVWFYAKHLVAPREAIWAGIFATFLVPFAANGAIYYPEQMLQLMLFLMLAFLIRAMRSNQLSDWALTGLCGAFGLFTHYRFAIPGVGVALFLVLTTVGRAQFVRPGLWLAGGLAALGAVPTVLYNLREAFSAVIYQTVTRQTWGWYPGGFLTRLGEQLQLLSPVFLILYGVVAWQILRHWKNLAPAPKLALVVALTVFGFYTAISPFYAHGLMHWIFLAYVPLLAFLPGAAISWVDSADIFQRPWRTRAIGLGVAWSVAALAVGFSIHLLWAHPNLVPVNQRHYFRLMMEDWRALKDPIAQARAALASPGGEPVPVAVSGTINAVRLEFPQSAPPPLYVLTDPMDIETGFGRMRARWGEDDAALTRDHAGDRVLLVVPDSSYVYHQPEETAHRAEACGRFDDVKLVQRVELEPGRLFVGLFSATVRATPAPPRFCALLPTVYLARPSPGEKLSDTPRNAFGMAAAPQGVAKVEILIDGKPVRTAEIGINEKTVIKPDVLRFDPAWPGIEFAVPLSVKDAPQGRARLSVETGAERWVYGGE